MKCARLSDTEFGNMPIGCYVNNLEIDAAEAQRLDGMMYSCDASEAGKLSLSFKPACDDFNEDCDTDQ